MSKQVSAASAASRSEARGLAVAVALALCGAFPAVHAEDYAYTLRRGDNPWNVTDRFLRDLSYWPRLLHYNQIADPHRLQPGSTLRIPGKWLRLRAADVRVSAMLGRVEIQPDGAGDADWQPVQVSQTLTAGHRLRTGADGSAMLEMAGGTAVLIRPDTELRLVHAEAPQILRGGVWVRIELIRGGLENVVQRGGANGSRFEIQTPAAVAAVRGTEFRVSAASDSARTEVLSGVIDFRSRAGGVRLPARTGSIAIAGQPPAPPATLLPAPDLAGLPDRIRRLPLSIELQPVAGAVRYQTQVFEPGSALILSDEASTTPHARARTLPDGDYRLRVRAVDAAGLEGLHAERALKIDARPEAPVLSSPPPQATLAAAAPAFRWTDAGVPAYRFQLSATPEFDAPVRDLVVDSTRLVLDGDPLLPGEYHWRVASRTAEGKEGPFSDTERLRLVPGSPAVDPAAQDGDVWRLRWQAGPPGATYRFQLARDERFGDIVEDHRVNEPSVALESLPAGEYHLRVQTLTHDGFEGAWSASQRIEVEARQSYWPLLLLVPLLILF